MKNHLKQISSFTGLGSLLGLGMIFGVPEQGVQLVGAAIVAVLNLFDFFRNEKKS